MNRKLLAVMASGALALPMAAQAVDISVSGHINRAIVVGEEDYLGDDFNMEDGGASPSRFRMTGSEELDNGVTAGVNLEYGVGATKADGNPNLRHSAIYLSGAFGKLTLGHTSQATDGIAYANFDGSAFLSGTEIGCDFCPVTALPTYGGSRSQVIRYDTAALGLATVAVSSDGEDFVDAAIRISGGMGDGGYMLNVGYGSTEDKQDHLVVSGALSLPGGMHTNLTWGQTDPDVKDSKKLDYWHFGVGYNIGTTSIAATYTDHDAALIASGKSWGVGIGHQMGSVELYSGYKHLDVDGVDDTGYLVVGSRISFN